MPIDYADIGDRFIPAHAGSRSGLSSAAALVSVHPRACGEQAPVSPLSPLSPGSSPRMRGSRRSLLSSVSKSTVPAHAGNRRSLN